MQESLLALGSAEQPSGAARRGLALQAHDFGPADRAPRGHLESIRRRPRSGLGDAHHFRNHVPRPSHYYGIPAPDILSAHFVLVVERGVGHGGTSYAHRFQTDRKSTRLNSSHLGISYAVFCLKKKNQSAQTVLRHPT